MNEKKFNLIDEPWIPIADIGLISLKQLFSNFEYQSLGGNPIEKIALTKLLLAIAQAAYTPNDDEDLKDLGIKGLSERCLAYLETKHDFFWLYGDKPFLQMPKISSAKLLNLGAVIPSIASGNTTILNESQIEKPLTNAEKALLIVTLVGGALGGKKTDNSVVLSKGYQGKLKPTGRPGPFIDSAGLMHNFLTGDSLLQSILINLFTKEDLNEKLTFYSEGLGITPWEKMPEGEECPIAISLQNSLMGRLIPLSRFCLLTENEIHYSEGIKYLRVSEGGIDPSIAINSFGKNPKAIWIDSQKRPWRSLSALLSFMSVFDKDQFDCYQIKLCLTRAREISTKNLGVWSGGLKISSNAGEQYVSGMDDFVNSNTLLPTSILGKMWYEQLKFEMAKLDELSKILYKATLNFFDSQKMKGDKIAKSACNLFWQLCEHNFKDLLVACQSNEEADIFRKNVFMPYLNIIYDQFCPKNTARQLDAWAKNRPNLQNLKK